MVRFSFTPVPVPPLPAGYLLRRLGADEDAAYAALYRRVFADPGRLPEMPGKTLPGGCFVIEHLAAQRLVASCRTYHGTGYPHRPAGGQLAWLMTDPAHSGRGLGTILAAAVTNHLLEAGYRQPFLRTDDDRLPAIALYLRLGWQPDLQLAGARDRWQRIFAALGLAAELSPDAS